MNEILDMCNKIAGNPNGFSVIHREMRRAVIRRFPFGIYYRIAQESSIVIAVLHGSRHPKDGNKDRDNAGLHTGKI